MTISSRCVEPELLDTLTPGDPSAIHARRDLDRVNALMGNARIVAKALLRVCRVPPPILVDLGAGDGAWAVRLAHALPASWHPGRIVLLDRQDTVSPSSIARLAARGWQPELVTADAPEWLGEQHAHTDNVVVANLFLHHFARERLASLLRLIARHARVLVACEPRRSQFALGASALLGFAGCNAVTRHDAQVSVRAGFADGEVSALWPRDPSWTIAESRCGLFSHRFVAVREGAA